MCRRKLVGRKFALQNLAQKLMAKKKVQKFAVFYMSQNESYQTLSM
jgi:hypothetical protein